MQHQDEKLQKATQGRPEGERVLDAPLMRLSIEHAERIIKNEKAWIFGDRNAITLSHSTNQRIVLVALRKNAELVHKAIDAALSIQVVSGRIWVVAETQSYSLDTAELATLHGGTWHSLYAEQESTILMTFSGTHCEDGPSPA